MLTSLFGFKESPVPHENKSATFHAQRRMCLNTRFMRQCPSAVEKVQRTESLLSKFVTFFTNREFDIS